MIPGSCRLGPIGSKELYWILGEKTKVTFQDCEPERVCRPSRALFLTEIRLGTSGWSYKEWEKVFYPSSETPKLTYYARFFDTVEVDSTFYVYPNQNVVMGWARNTPRDFKFSVKLPRQITHEKKLDLTKGVEVDLKKFLELLRPLVQAKKLGAILIQLPPSFTTRYLGNLREFLKALPTGLVWAVEFRHDSWLDGDGWDLLKEYRVANVIVDEPLLPPDPVVTSDVAFIRWHGFGKRIWYDYLYEEEELKPWVRKLNEVSKKTESIYGYFNNHFHGYAVKNLLDFGELNKTITEEQVSLRSKIARHFRNISAQTRLLEF